MNVWIQKHRGYTLVELMIVIAVIALLVAITIITYNGVQGRGYDASIKSDLSGYSKALQVYYSDNNRYPINASELATLDGVFTQNAYSTSASNLMYCINTADPSTFAIGALSKSGAIWYLIPGKTGQISAQTIAVSNVCMTAEINSATATIIYGYQSPGGWQAWAQ